MIVRKRYIVPRTALPADSYTYRVDFPAVGALSAIEIIVEAQNGASGCTTATMPDAVSLIQLIADGSRPLVNLAGWDAFKLAAYYNFGVHPSLWSEGPSDIQTFKFLIPFGRYVGDLFYWLRLQDYSSLYLDIVFSFPIGATAFVTGNKFLTVIGYFFEPMPTTRLGLFKHAVFTVFTTEGSGDRMIKLPQGNLIPWVYVFAYRAATRNDSVLSWIKLDVNDGATTLLEGRWHELVMDNFYRDGIYGQLDLLAFRSDNTSVATRMDSIENVVISLETTYAAGANVPVYSVRSVAGDTITYSGVLVSGTSTYAPAALDTTSRRIRTKVFQRGTGSFLKMQPGLSSEQEDFIDTTKYGNVRLIFTQSMAGGLVKVIPVEVLLT